MGSVALTVLCGPPCSGKTTLAGTMDLPVLDWDEFYARITRLPLHARAAYDGVVAPQVETAFRAAIDHAIGAHVPTVIIRAAPLRRQREDFRERCDARVVVLEVAARECVRRLRQCSHRPRETWRATEEAIRSWWTRYQPSPLDTVMDECGEVPRLPAHSSDRLCLPRPGLKARRVGSIV
jgi:shikimate kinase